MPLSLETTFTPSRDIAWDFEGQVVVITGAAHGQGAEHARSFAAAGADIVISDIAGEMEFVEYPLGTIDELESVAREVRETGRSCLSTVCDVRRPEQVRSLVERTIEQFGRIDVLVCNAGIASIGKFDTLPLAKWSETIDTNLNGAFYFCKYVAPHMAARGSGRIVVTGSTAAIGGAPWVVHYTASKHAVYGLVKGLAVELESSGVTVNLVCPSVVDTTINLPFVDERFSEWMNEANQLLGSWNILLDGMMHEQEITQAVLFLASREAGNMTGAALLVDGGAMCK